MALEASERLIDIINWSIGGVPVNVFQGLPSNSVPDIMGKSREMKL